MQVFIMAGFLFIFYDRSWLVYLGWYFFTESNTETSVSSPSLWNHVDFWWFGYCCICSLLLRTFSPLIGTRMSERVKEWEKERERVLYTHKHLVQFFFFSTHFFLLQKFTTSDDSKRMNDPAEIWCTSLCHRGHQRSVHTGYGSDGWIR